MSKFIDIKENDTTHSINIDFIVSVSENKSIATIHLNNREIVTQLSLEKVKVLIANASPY
ncbi:hypothetical protein ACLI08_14860 [Flavobacterium sp. RNTU_13]|uniref:Flagellar protein FlbD n=1 Tax=Flavobacterium akiainvivens TaxID=1202724 RepID=A0A0M8M9L5_9FLAO|nr:hypothetical protein [Flavobacterium akiainvivens]KOS05405.1 hypothetical protein AM493_04675 [Flavobacterium akiainvivens]SFQ73636.1 hypothetical protein SAMN05444144_11916 [Flavobacterium akiainvivens]